jgi:hypothetical protein
VPTPHRKGRWGGCRSKGSGDGRAQDGPRDGDDAHPQGGKATSEGAGANEIMAKAAALSPPPPFRSDSVWVSGGRKWVLGSSKAVNAACLAVFDLSTNSAVSRQLESAKKSRFGGVRSSPLEMYVPKQTRGAPTVL